MAGFFPTDVAAPLIQHMKRPTYTHSGDVELTRALLKYDKRDVRMLQDMPEGVAFKLTKKSRIVLMKGEKMKKQLHQSEKSRP